MRAGALIVLALLAGCPDAHTPTWDAVDSAASTVSADRDSAVADGLDAVLVTVVARDSRGAALRGRPVSLVVSGATSIAPATGTTGVGGALTALLTSQRAGVVTVQVAVDGVLLADRPRVTFVSDEPPDRQLTVAVGGSGAGSVTANGQRCAATCSLRFPAGATVSLGAEADAGSTFTGWTGACTGDGDCSVVMDGDVSVGAGFEAARPADAGLASSPPGVLDDSAF